MTSKQKDNSVRIGLMAFGVLLVVLTMIQYPRVPEHKRQKQDTIATPFPNHSQITGCPGVTSKFGEE